MSENKALYAIHILPNSRSLININLEINNSNNYHSLNFIKLIRISKATKTTYLTQTTRGRPQIDTNSIPITRSYRALNKTKMELPTGNPTNNIISIATQTDDINNIGQGCNPILSKQQYNPFTDIDYDSSPDFLKNLYKAFNEEFIAEATKTDPPKPKFLTNHKRQRLGHTKTFQPLLAFTEEGTKHNTIRLHPIRWKHFYANIIAQNHHEFHTSQTTRTIRNDASSKSDLVTAHP